MSDLILSRDEVRQVDRIAMEQYGVPGTVLMENAGRGVVDVMRQHGVCGPVCICCGAGNNAGDGFVIARHLDLLDIHVDLLCCTDPSRLQGDAEINHRICERMGLRLHNFKQNGSSAILEQAAWIVDCLLGTGARGAPRPPMDEIVRLSNRSPARRLAVDVPTGLDCDTGIASEPTFRADITCTFVANKPMVKNPDARPFLGETYVVDIGAPRQILRHFQ